MITLLHISLSIVIFFGINLLGHYTPSNLGYYQLTSFLETDEAPAFNYLIRVLTPVVGIILLSALFYSLAWDNLVINIYMVNVYYVSFRFLFNWSINRALLLNWKRQLIYSLSIVVLSYFSYEKLIKFKSHLLPDFSNIANELWIIILIFLYNVINNLQNTDEKAEDKEGKLLKKKISGFETEIRIFH